MYRDHAAPILYALEHVQYLLVNDVPDIVAATIISEEHGLTDSIAAMVVEFCRQRGEWSYDEAKVRRKARWPRESCPTCEGFRTEVLYTGAGPDGTEEDPCIACRGTGYRHPDPEDLVEVQS